MTIINVVTSCSLVHFYSSQLVVLNPEVFGPLTKGWLRFENVPLGVKMSVALV